MIASAAANDSALNAFIPIPPPYAQIKTVSV
jgi:hypothetical protein